MSFSASFSGPLLIWRSNSLLLLYAFYLDLSIIFLARYNAATKLEISSIIDASLISGVLNLPFVFRSSNLHEALPKVASITAILG